MKDLLKFLTTACLIIVLSMVSFKLAFDYVKDCAIINDPLRD